jgi:hypothetical protein
MRFWKRHVIRLRVGVWITGSGKDRMVVNLLNELNKDFIGYPKLSTKKPWAVNFPLLEKMDLWGMNSGNTSMKNTSPLYFINPCQNSMLKSNNLFRLEKKDIGLA